MDADELVRIEALFQSGNGLQQQIGPRRISLAHMQADIVAFGVDPPDFGSRNADQFAAMRDPQFLEPGTVGAFAVTASCDRAGHSAFEPLGLDRLEDVIDRLEVEGFDRVIVMCGDEDDRGALCLVGERLRNRHAIDFGHRHVEQHEIGLQRLDQPQGLRPVARRSDHLQFADLRADDLHAFDRKRFVIDDKRLEPGSGFVSHVSPSVV